MSTRLQFARWMMGVALCGAVSLTCAAQKNHPAPPPPHQNPPKPQNQNQTKPNRPPVTSQDRIPAKPPSNNRPNQGTGSVAGAGTGANIGPARNLTPKQQLGVGAPRPWVEKMRQMPPAQRERFFQNSPAFQRMPPEQQNKIRQQFDRWDRMNPQQRADLQSKEDTWRKLTPEQKNHIKNDVYPRYQQLPPDRQHAIERRLQILQNMPESARNQRLNDPRFTEGMSEEDRATLRDLSHLHVGGAPDPPQE